MKLFNVGHTFNYETEKLIRLFLPFEKIEILHEFYDIAEDFAVTSLSDVGAVSRLCINGCDISQSVIVCENADNKETELAVATSLFKCFVKYTGYKPKWGLLTGVRPAKLYSRLTKSIGKEQTEKYFKEKLFVSNEKIALCRESRTGEEKITALSKNSSFSLYISVPFCPSRCSYCSFVSHSVEKAEKLIEPYVELLCKELELTGQLAFENKLTLETVYMGGGTPTTLSAQQLKKVLTTAKKAFDFSTVREFTVEAGRPDTITAEKLKALKECGVQRISINPQTMNDAILKKIGRNHTEEQMLYAFSLARSIGFNNINTDLIAGLPGDTFESFCTSLEKIIALNPESVTVHSLAMKRVSNLSASKTSVIENSAVLADKMVSYAKEALTGAQIKPYYMYRQSKTVGNLENVGYAKKGYECLYNVYIMDETHTILGCGASAVTKLRQPGGDRIERIFNYKYPYEYINDFDRIINRKQGITEFYSRYPVT